MRDSACVDRLEHILGTPGDGLLRLVPFGVEMLLEVAFAMQQ